MESRAQTGVGQRLLRPEHAPGETQLDWLELGGLGASPVPGRGRGGHGRPARPVMVWRWRTATRPWRASAKQAEPVLAGGAAAIERALAAIAGGAERHASEPR